MTTRTTHNTRTYLERALEEGHAEIVGEGRNERIHYIAADHYERWSDPEEKVRAEFWAELIYKYEYLPERIAFEVTVPDRTPSRQADLVVYEDDELRSPYFVFECKRADLSDAAFDQSIEQSVGNKNLLGANYCGATAPDSLAACCASISSRLASVSATEWLTFLCVMDARPNGAFTRTRKART